MHYSTATEIVPTALDRLETRTSIGGRVMSAFLILVGVGAILLAALGSRLFPIPPVVLGCFSYPFGAFFVVLGLFMFGGWQRMTFDGRDHVLRLRRPAKGLGREIPFAHVEVVEIVLDDSADIAGKIDLVLLQPAGRRLSVAMRHTEDKLQSDVSRLAEFIGVPVRDARKIDVPVSDTGAGGQVAVSRRFNETTGAASFCTHELADAGPDLLVVKVTSGSLMFRNVFLGSGIVALLCVPLLAHLAFAGTSESFWGALGGAAICLAVGGAFVICSLKLMPCSPVFIDRKGGEIRGKKLRLAGGLVAELPLRLVAAVQMVSGRIYPSEDPSYIAYQINLVLSKPPGERLAIMAHAKEQEICSDARRLADFLSVPLLDHRG